MADTLEEQKVIVIKNLSKYFKHYDRPGERLLELFPFVNKHKKVKILDDISLTIRKGEVVGIVGRNGAGKSTLLKIISQIILPTSGSIYINGSISSLIGIGVGFNGEMKAKENIKLQGMILGLNSAEVERRIPSIIEFAEISDNYIDRPVKFYSSGMYSRLAFAAAIYSNPDILIVDETLAVGDFAFSKKCMDRIKNFRDEGKTILFVSHSDGQISSLCDRAVYLKDGKVAADGKPAEIVEIYHQDALN